MTRLFTSESVTPGHPDKVCDQISDAILDAYLTVDPEARVAVEVMATAGGIVIGGEVGSEREVDHAATARQVLDDIGYRAASGLDPYAYPILDVVTNQSPEIAAGVYESEEARDQAAFDADDFQGAGDQGLMFGYATDETPALLPMPACIAHDLARTLTEARQAGGNEHVILRPDGKTQVTVAYDGAKPVRVDTIVVSTQHAPEYGQEEIAAYVLARVIRPVLRHYSRMLDVSDTRALVNPSGSFVLGGPAADAGLTGRKIIVDTYGGMARHGGGAFSGKDPSKVDRSGAYAMRWVAKNVVAAGLAKRCEVQVAYAIGRAHPVGLYVDTFGTGTMPDTDLANVILGAFDLRPSALIRELDLKRPIYRETATFGHFGLQADEKRPWERLDKVQALRAAVGATGPVAAVS